MRQNDDSPMSAGDEASGVRHDDPAWALVERIGQGDRAAFSELYREYYDYVTRFVLQTTRRPELVDEVVNEVMYAVWQQAPKARRLARVSTWILSIAYRRAVSALRRTTAESANVPLDPDEPGLAVTVDTESADLLGAALQRLAPDQRAVMELVYFDDLRYHEIARILDCPENTVKTRMFHARRKLRQLWPILTGAERKSRRSGR